jgi:segregation and condensation protein A
MTSQFAGRRIDSYKVTTDLYEGPLDLLLQLIEKSELDITRLSLAEVTDQYLSYLEQMEFRDPAEVSAFLIMAARLVQIKSLALLPSRSLPESENDSVEDSAEALAAQLLQYRRFKQLGSVLDDRQRSGLRTYFRLVTTTINYPKRFEMEGITTQNLVQAARTVFMDELTLPGLSTVITMPRITIREKIHAIIEFLRRSGTSTFSSIVEKQGRLDAVISFLALLELIKRSVVEVQQPDLFGEINLTPVGEWDDNPEIEMEFGD